MAKKTYMLTDEESILQCPMGCHDGWTHIDWVKVVPNTYNRNKKDCESLQKDKNMPIEINHIGGAGASEDCKVTIGMYCEQCGEFEIELSHHEGQTTFKIIE